MSDQLSQPPPNDKFKAEMPHIPGVSTVPAKAHRAGRRWVVFGGIIFLIVAGAMTARLLTKPRLAERANPRAAQIEVPAPVGDLAASVPVATQSGTSVASISELARPWSSRPFIFYNRDTGEKVAALLIRLPGESPLRSSGYWSFAMKPIYGDCKLDYVEDLQKLKGDYGYRHARHPMVVNPCTRSVYDPLKYATLPGDILARGAIVQGSDLRPPLSIEIKLKGKEILAGRME